MAPSAPGRSVGPPAGSAMEATSTAFRASTTAAATTPTGAQAARAPARTRHADANPPAMRSGNAAARCPVRCRVPHQLPTLRTQRHLPRDLRSVHLRHRRANADRDAALPALSRAATTWHRRPRPATQRRYVAMIDARHRDMHESFPRRGARVDDSARLESVCTVRYRGFESHPLRFPAAHDLDATPPTCEHRPVTR